MYLDEIQQEEFYGIKTACDALKVQHENCLAHPASCQSAKMSISNYERTIRIRTRSLFSLKRVCEPSSYSPSEEIISRCHEGLSWNPGKNATDDFAFITSLFEGFTMEFLRQEKGTALERPKRFVFTTPIIVGSIIGAASIATSGITAAVIASKEVQGVVEAELMHRIEDVDNAIINDYINLNLTALIAKDIDNIRKTEAWSSDSANSVSHAEASNNVISHLFSRSGVFEFSDPNTEKYYSRIERTVSKNSVGLTKLELKEMTRLSTDITNIVTMAIPISGHELKCDNMLLVKTMITPVLNHRSRKEVTFCLLYTSPSPRDS